MCPTARHDFVDQEGDKNHLNHMYKCIYTYIDVSILIREQMKSKLAIVRNVRREAQ